MARKEGRAEGVGFEPTGLSSKVFQMRTLLSLQSAGEVLTCGSVDALSPDEALVGHFGRRLWNRLWPALRISERRAEVPSCLMP